MKRAAAVLFLTIILLGMTACARDAVLTDTPTRPVSSGTARERADKRSLSGLTDALEREGLGVRENPSIANPGVFDGDATFYGYSVDEGELRAFVVDDDVEMDQIMARIAEDGSSYSPVPGTVVHVSWVGRPRFFTGGRIVVLYLEDQQSPRVSEATDRRVMGVLTALLGQPFAGMTGE